MGIALLASYMNNKAEDEALDDYLDAKDICRTEGYKDGSGSEGCRRIQYIYRTLQEDASDHESCNRDYEIEPEIFYNTVGG